MIDTASFGTVVRSLKKYKYVLLILVLGLGLLLLPGNKREAKVPEKTCTTLSSEDYVRDMEQRLVKILSRIEGVGETEVILTLRQGEEAHYLYDTELRNESDSEEAISEETKKTVIFSAGNAYDEPMVTRKDYPLFQGALIVCRGGDDPMVQLKLIQAVSALTDLSSHKITILKMK